jgi:hypothetical protein
LKKQLSKAVTDALRDLLSTVVSSLGNSVRLPFTVEHGLDIVPRFVRKPRIDDGVGALFQLKVDMDMVKPLLESEESEQESLDDQEKYFDVSEDEFEVSG